MSSEYQRLRTGASTEMIGRERSGRGEDKDEERQRETRNRAAQQRPTWPPAPEADALILGSVLLEQLLCQPTTD